MNIGNTNLETRLQCHDPINSNFIYLWSLLHSISHFDKFHVFCSYVFQLIMLT